MANPWTTGGTSFTILIISISERVELGIFIEGSRPIIDVCLYVCHLYLLPEFW